MPGERRPAKRGLALCLEWSAIAVGALSLAVAGCSVEEESSRTPKARSEFATPIPAPTADRGATAAIDLQPVDEAGIAKAVVSHRGEVVVLDVWATWCGPCVKEFPRLAKWNAKYGPEGLAVIAVSIDNEEDRESKVLPFLRKQDTEGVDLLQYIGGDHDAMVNSIDREWAGEVPALFIYDRAGKRVASLPGEREAKDVEARIEDVLTSASI